MQGLAAGMHVAQHTRVHAPTMALTLLLCRCPMKCHRTSLGSLGAFSSSSWHAAAGPHGPGPSAGGRWRRSAHTTCPPARSSPQTRGAPRRTPPAPPPPAGTCSLPPAGAAGPGAQQHSGRRGSARRRWRGEEAPLVSALLLPASLPAQQQRCSSAGSTARPPTGSLPALPAAALILAHTSCSDCATGRLAPGSAAMARMRLPPRRSIESGFLAARNSTPRPQRAAAAANRAARLCAAGPQANAAHAARAQLRGTRGGRRRSRGNGRASGRALRARPHRAANGAANRTAGGGQAHARQATAAITGRPLQAPQHCRLPAPRPRTS